MEFHLSKRFDCSSFTFSFEYVIYHGLESCIVRDGIPGGGGSIKNVKFRFGGNSRGAYMVGEQFEDLR